MDKVTLTIGGREVELTPSDRLVGVRRRGQRGLTRLGGFELLSLDVAPGGPGVEDALEELRAAPDVTTGTHVFHTSDDGVPFVPTGRIYIEFAPQATVEQSQGVLRDFGLQIVEPKGEQEVLVQTTPGSPNPITVCQRLQESGYVDVAEPDLATPASKYGFTLPSDPLLEDEWHLLNHGTVRGVSLGLVPGADARVIPAWQQLQSLGSREVIVAVIDDGFDLSHPDLAGDWKVVAPWDFTRGTDDPAPGGDDDRHGTAVAGVAVGNANGACIVGAAPDCRLMPVRWGLNLAGSAVASWFDHAREHGARVVSCSWGPTARFAPLPTVAARAIERCAREGSHGHGAVICFAAGNAQSDIDDHASGTLNGYATHPDVLTVAASTSLDEAARDSNRGKAVAVCAPSSGAPGWGIVTADVQGDAGYAPGGFTRTFGGTSSACPLVAGVCALVISARPDLHAEQVRSLIKTTARRIGNVDEYGPDGHHPRYGYGCVNAEAAVSAALAHPHS